MGEQEKKESNIVITVPVATLTPNGARPSASAVQTEKVTMFDSNILPLWKTLSNHFTPDIFISGWQHITKSHSTLRIVIHVKNCIFMTILSIAII